jgi:mono/diheme cytochrome c family protein
MNKKKFRMRTKADIFLGMLLLGFAGSWTPVLYAQTSASAVGTPGEELYKRHCAVCHGIDGRADTPIAKLLQTHPRNFADPVEMARVDDDDIYQAIKEGRPGTAMPAWGPVFSELQVGSLMDYVRSLTAPRSPALTAEKLSIEIGRRIYKRDCAECHGADGRVDTDAAKILRPRPVKFADPIEMARVDDGRMYSAIKLGRPGTSMGGWGGLLNPAEIIDVMRYVRTLQQPLPSEVSKSELDVMVGEQIYRQYCTGCHGVKGDASTALGHALVPHPRNFTSATEMTHLGPKEVAEAITHGKPGTAMAPWNGILNPEDIRRVTRYILHTFQHQT